MAILHCQSSSVKLPDVFFKTCLFNRQVWVSQMMLEGLLPMAGWWKLRLVHPFVYAKCSSIGEQCILSWRMSENKQQKKKAWWYLYTHAFQLVAPILWGVPQLSFDMHWPTPYFLGFLGGWVLAALGAVSCCWHSWARGRLKCESPQVAELRTSICEQCHWLTMDHSTTVVQPSQRWLRGRGSARLA